VTWMLDTNACIDYLRFGGNSQIANRLASKNDKDVVLCSVVRAELIFGAIRSRDAAANLAQVGEFLANFFSFAFDDVAADAYGQIRADLVNRGLTIGPNDLLIASIAQAHNLTLVTHNTDEFGRVPGLSIEDWEAE
jgi:tRNA(fMet)-specific endonuclease VapC